MTGHILQHLGPYALAIGVGYLFGRWQRHCHTDRVEADAWDDGFTEALRVVCGFNPDDAVPLVDEASSGRLDAAQEQISPRAWPGWN